MQFIKTYSPNSFIVSAIVTERRTVLFSNALLPIAVTVYPSIFDGMAIAVAEPLYPVIVALLLSSNVYVQSVVVVPSEFVYEPFE